MLVARSELELKRVMKRYIDLKDMIILIKDIFTRKN